MSNVSRKLCVFKFLFTLHVPIFKTFALYYFQNAICNACKAKKMCFSCKVTLMVMNIMEIEMKRKQLTCTLVILLTGNPPRDPEGQIIPKQNCGVLDFPKKQRNYCKDFCPSLYKDVKSKKQFKNKKTQKNIQLVV